MLRQIPVVGSLGYAERARALPAVFQVSLTPEPDNPYNPKALAVLGPDGGKIGYVAPEVAREWFESIAGRAAAGERLSCGARRADPAARDSSGVEFYLDFSGMAAEGPG
jgi:hypothetical protein